MANKKETRNHLTDAEKVKRWHGYAKEHGWKGKEAIERAEIIAGGRVAALADWVKKNAKAHKPKAKGKKVKSKAKKAA